MIFAITATFASNPTFSHPNFLDPKIFPRNENQMKEQQPPFPLREGDWSERQRIDARRYESWDRMNNAIRAQRNDPNHRARSRVNGASKSPIRSPIQSPPRSPVHHPQNPYRSLSPASRAQAIARGQRELMEMVKNMPETCYELSLKDLVEHSHRQEEEGEEEEEEEERNDVSSETDLLETTEKRRSVYSDVVSGRGRVTNTGSGQGQGQGHMLKMVFPLSFGPKKKKKKATKAVGAHIKNGASTASLLGSDDVARKPSGGNSDNNGDVDKEWWKKRYSGSGDSDRSGGDQLSSSSNSGGSKSSSTSGSRSSSLTSRSNSNNARHGSRSGGCWWFIGKIKGRHVE